MKRALIRVHGRVQGVFFRHTASMRAKELGLSGFARNEPDGAVYIEAEGERESLEKFLAWCRKGPSQAMVKNAECSFSDELRHFNDFSMQ